MTGHAYVPCLPHSLEQLGFLNRLIGPGSEYTVFFVHSDENRAEKKMSEFLSHPSGDAYAPNTTRTAHTTCPRFPGLQARGSSDALSRPRFQRPGEMIPFQRGTNADVVTQDVHKTIPKEMARRSISRFSGIPTRTRPNRRTQLLGNGIAMVRVAPRVTRGQGLVIVVWTLYVQSGSWRG